MIEYVKVYIRTLNRIKQANALVDIVMIRGVAVTRVFANFLSVDTTSIG
jgi:hypothetical protein